MAEFSANAREPVQYLVDVFHPEQPEFAFLEYIMGGLNHRAFTFVSMPRKIAALKYALFILEGAEKFEREERA